MGGHISTEERVFARIAWAKEQAAIAFAAGSPKGLTALALGFYEVLERNSTRKH